MEAHSYIQIAFLIITLRRIDEQLPSLDRRTPALSRDMRVISLRRILPEQFSGEQWV